LPNDGTTEDISAIEEIASKDNRIKIINLPHKGVSNTRNYAITASSGEFIAFLDSDDLWAPEKLEIQLNYMLDNGFAFSHTSFEQRFLNGDLLERYDVSTFKGDVFFKSIYSWLICICTVMFERSTIGPARFPEYISMGEDICLWFHFTWRYEIGAISNILTTVRVQNVSASQNIDKRREAVYSVIGFLLKNYNFEECLVYIGMLVHGLYTLFPTQPPAPTPPPAPASPVVSNSPAVPTSPVVPAKPIEKNVTKPINPRNYPLRFLLALNNYGFKGFCRKFIQKVKVKLSRRKIT